MKARRLSLVLSLPLALGLLGCGREDDAMEDQRDVPATTGEDDGSLREADEQTPTAPPPPSTEPSPGEQGIPPVPNETGDPMYRDQEFERGGETGSPRQTDPDQATPGRTPGGGAND